jgi:2-isopropylmalate synthase
MPDRIYLYDSTLRDGAQARGVDFTVPDKLAITRALDGFGIDYIEGGWPGANPRDDAFFADAPHTGFARLTAFGMTRRAGRSAANDPGLAALLDAGTQSVCIVGKAWEFHIEKALEITPQENQAMISDSVVHLVKNGREAIFDAEHFFDGYKHNKEVALRMARAAFDAGARWVVLCDTNGGTLPHQIGEIVSEVVQIIPGARLGIHCHNDTENAVANSLAAVEAGVRQVQGTINGIGERCGNANLISLIATLMLKLGYETGVSTEKLKEITHLSRLVDDRLARTPNPHAAYVGSAAFAHKGGLHVSAMAKDTASYEHIPPERVGNERVILVSDKAGRANLLARLKQLGLENIAENARIEALVALVKERETEGYAYEGADASFELLARRHLTEVPEYFKLESFRVMDERRWNARGELITLSEATIKLHVKGRRILTVSEGNGPVNALDKALRKALSGRYPVLKDIRLTDYKVRILTPGQATAATTRVMIESRDGAGNVWNTIGVSPNVIDASWGALHDSLTYRLLKEGVEL